VKLLLSNQECRKILTEYIRNKGVKQKYLAKKIGVSETTLSLFLRNLRELSQHKLNIIGTLYQ